MERKIKITKEQYNRIFASKLLKENVEKSSDIDFKKEVGDLIHYFYGITNEFPPNLEQRGISYDEISDILLDKKIIIPKDNHYEISKKMGSVKNAKEIIGHELKSLLDSKNMIDEENFPVGVEPHTSNAPWNEKEMEPIETPETKNVEINGPLKLMGSNEELSILSDGTNLFVFLYGDLSEVPMKGEEVENFISKHKEEVGYGLEDWESGDKRLVQIDDILKDDLIQTHSHDEKFKNALLQNNGLEEVTASGSAGQYTGLFSGGKNEPIKRDLDKQDVPVVYETMTASPSTVGPYDTNALPGINRDGSYKKTPKSNAEKKTQWAGGSFVKIDDCTKLNNNKVAQKGGCSTGAVDNVVKTVKTSANVNAPSLKGGK